MFKDETDDATSTDSRQYPRRKFFGPREASFAVRQTILASRTRGRLLLHGIHGREGRQSDAAEAIWYAPYTPEGNCAPYTANLWVHADTLAQVAVGIESGARARDGHDAAAPHIADGALC